MAEAYRDACCFIYLVEGEPKWKSVVSARMAAFGPAARLATSELSRLECRTKPMHDGNLALLAQYDSLFSAARLELVALNTAVIDCATLLRAEYGFKTPDALHLATALESGASVFVTADGKLKRCSAIRVEVLQPSIT